MISRRELMAGSVALAVAASAPGRLAPEPESILVNDIHSQLNSTRVLGILQPRSLEDVQSIVRSARKRSENNFSCRWATCDGRAAVRYRHLVGGYQEAEPSTQSGSQARNYRG